MNQQTTRIPPEAVARQREFCQKIAELTAARSAQPLAFVDTYGCPNVRV